MVGYTRIQLEYIDGIGNFSCGTRCVIHDSPPPLINRGTIRNSIIGTSFLVISAFLSITISKQETIKYWGISYVFWALLIGLILQNLSLLPDSLSDILQSEVYIKTGLVILGAEIALKNLMTAGIAGIFETTVGLSIVWYSCYWLANRSGMSKSFAAVMASATAICGVSAAIAAGGAVKGDPKEISYTISLVLLFSMPLLILMPLIAKTFGIPAAVTGAWIGGTIDTTGAVVAAGAIYNEVAMQTASIVKLSQNIMIAVAAFILSIYWTMVVEKTPEDTPSLGDIWKRFPKFVIGFLLACIVFNTLPTMGYATRSILKTSKTLRSWLFAMAFTSIGYSTNFKELVSIGKGKPFLVFTASTVLDLVVPLVSAYIFFS